MKTTCSMHPFGAAQYRGRLAEAARFIQDRQLLDEELWAKLVGQFGAGADDADLGWRGEYWGKMMRGACLTYRYTGDRRLYETLVRTTDALLDRQEADGRISSYSRDAEFTGWDMWCRKYVLTGLLYFAEICRDPARKERLYAAACRHVDYILERIGDRPGQTPITATSHWWGGVNSCSILEAIVWLYKQTKNERYLEFARYIVGTGGCADGDLIALSLQNRKKPHEYPVVKAYEVMSFFSGVLEYYTVCRERKYLRAVENFVRAVRENEITAIGCAGCTHELFDNAAVRQTEYSETIMQETCVTVTWQLLCFKLLALTGDAELADSIEQSGYNALLGSVNFENNASFSLEENAYVEPLPFDSYSPLVDNRRGRGIGGFKRFAQGGCYGCCVSIGAAGTALMPLTAVTRMADGVAVHFYLNGTVTVSTPAGQPLRVNVQTGYPADGKVRLRLSPPKPEQFALYLRIPGWCEKAVVTCGDDILEVGPGYCRLDRLWTVGTAVVLRLPVKLRAERQGGKACFFYGPLCLACDSLKQAGGLQPLADRNMQTALLAPLPGEQVRLELTSAGQTVLLTDYASCGRDWRNEAGTVTVWLPLEEGIDTT